MNDLNKLKQAISNVNCPQTLEFSIDEKGLNNEFAHYPYTDPKIDLLGYQDSGPEPQITPA